MQNVLVTRKGKDRPVAPRLNILFARESPVAVIFRRGPSAWTQLIRWDTDNDTFETGQWFRGRIYDRRSDLSPDGSLLVYFVRKINGRTLRDREYTYAWTSVSKPPYLTALALWPKGDCWAGGGRFLDGQTLELNHPVVRALHHREHSPEGHLSVRFRTFVHGEDDPIYSERLERDGWKLQSDWIFDPEDRWSTLEPQIRLKRNLESDLAIALSRSFHKLDYAECFEVQNRELGIYADVDRADWVDFDQRGRLIVARDGRISIAVLSEDGLIVETCLIDFTSNQPEPVVAPAWATQW